MFEELLHPNIPPELQLPEGYDQPPPTPLEFLRHAYQNLTAYYAWITYYPQPNLSGVAHSSHQQSILDQIEQLRHVLRANGDPEFAPFEIRSRGGT
jgi:hypothetical protein